MISNCTTANAHIRTHACTHARELINILASAQTVTYAIILHDDGDDDDFAADKLTTSDG